MQPRTPRPGPSPNEATDADAPVETSAVASGGEGSTPPDADPPGPRRAGRRSPVHDPRLLDTMFWLALVLYLPAILDSFEPSPRVVGALSLLVVLAGLWIWWRVRRAAQRRSLALAIAVTIVAFALFLLADNFMSVGVQWMAVLVLTLEAGVAASTAYAAAIATVTSGVHLAVGNGWGRSVLEGGAALLLMGVGIDFAALLRRAERLDDERVRALERLEQANEAQRRRHALEQDLVIADERARVATALHDGLGHRLTAIGLGLDYAELMAERDPARAAGEVRAARQTASDALDEMRRVVRAMHPVTNEGDVVDSLAAIARSFGSTGLDVSFERRGDAPVADADGLLLLRFAQEGLTNVVRHSGATHAVLRLEHEPGSTRLSLVDDGRGAGAPGGAGGGAALADGFGIRTLRERAETAGGRLEVAPRVNDERGGFSLAMTLPRRDGGTT